MRDADEVFLSAHHEAAHAVFAYYDGTHIDEVWVSDERGICTIHRADLYERYLPWKYAQFCLAGAYAAAVAEGLEHPKPGEMPMSRLSAEAGRVPEGDAWQAIEALRRVVAREDGIFDSVGEAYTFATIKLARLVEERWAEIEAVAFELYERWVSNEETVGKLLGADVTQIINSVREEKEHV